VRRLPCHAPKARVIRKVEVEVKAKVKVKVEVEVEDEVGPIHVRRFGIGPEPDALVKSQKAKAKGQSPKCSRRPASAGGCRKLGDSWLHRLCVLCTTSVQDRRFREDASLLRLCPEAIWILKTVVKCRPPATLESGSSRDSIRVHLRSSVVTSLVAASEVALGPPWSCLHRFSGACTTLTYGHRINIVSPREHAP
jgi:hypothetical protein